MARFIILTLLVAAASAIPLLETSDELIDFLNSQPDMTWTAGENPLPDLSAFPSDFDPSTRRQLPIKDEIPDLDAIPASFDARKAWPGCKSIGMIRDSGSCASWWAEAVTAAISDRICIAHQQQMNPIIAAADPLACCDDCWYDNADGCVGGWTGDTWGWLVVCVTLALLRK